MMRPFLIDMVLCAGFAFCAMAAGGLVGSMVGRDPLAVALASGAAAWTGIMLGYFL